MNDVFPFIVAGVASGSVYALAGMGLVLTYKTSGVFNFAHGALATVSAYSFYELHYKRDIAWPVAGLLSLFLVGVVGGFVLERASRRLAGADVATKVLATVGLLVAIQGVATARYERALSVPSFLPTRTFRMAGLYVSYDQLVVFLVGILSTVGLTIVLRRTRLGVGMRGVVDRPSLLALSGTNPARVGRWAWVIGASFAAVSGILLIPSIGLDSTLLTLLVVQAFGAAAFGYFTSLPLTYVGGLFVGVGQALLTKWTVNLPELGGLPPSFPFVVLFIVLLVVPRRLLVSQGERGASRAMWVAPKKIHFAGYLIVLSALLAVPILAGTKLLFWTDGVIFVLVFLSLDLLVRTSGQVSIAHVGFVAVGAATFSNLAHGPGVPWLLALVAAGLVTVPVGALVAIPAIRLSGIYLAVATFGFGLVLERLFYTTALMFSAKSTRLAPRPAFLGINFNTDRSFYYLVLAVAVVATILIIMIQSSRLGRLLRALAGSPLALETYGTSVNVTRVLVFCVAAFLAGIAGALFASKAGEVNGTSFPAFNSLTWLAVLMLAGTLGRGSTVSTSLIAALLLAVIPGYIHDKTLLDYQPLAYGAAAIAVALRAGEAASGAVQRITPRATDRATRSPVRARRGRAREFDANPPSTFVNPAQ